MYFFNKSEEIALFKLNGLKNSTYRKCHLVKNEFLESNFLNVKNEKSHF